MKKQILLKVAIALFLSAICSAHFKVKAKSGDSAFHHILKLDFVASYYTFFDNKKQARIGLEYERKITPSAFLSCYIDFGMYDNYQYIKYYDFFNQNNGKYSIEQNVVTKGFHLMPGYNYCFLKLKKIPNLGLFAGGIFDFSFYQKKINYFNSQTLDKSYKKNYQTRMGAGPAIGAYYKLGAHVSAEVKTSLFAKIISISSDRNALAIKPHNAQWTDTNNNFLWVTNVKLGYAF